MAEKHVLNQNLLREFHVQPWQDVVYAFSPKTMTPTRFSHLLRTTCAIMSLAKGSWNSERDDMVFDQPDAVHPSNDTLGGDGGRR
jgi:hypothetical protein